MPRIRVRRPFAAALAFVFMTVLPALAGGVPNAEPPPPPKDNDKPGALVIVGGGNLPDAIRDRFLELAGGKNGKLVVIPTASEQAERKRISVSCAYWKTQGLASVELLHTLDQKKANDPSFVKPLTEATAAWLGGGDQTRLSKAYRGTAVERELRRLVARGGVVGGTSAGASVMSSVMITGGNPEARVGDGFGLLPDVVIDQHFRNRKRQQRLLSVLVKYPRCLGLGIDEETAVVVSGHTFKVLGKANVSVCFPPMDGEEGSVKLLKSGEDGDLLQLSQRVMARFKVPTESKPVATKTSRATAP
ncbi:MAG: cyanophycinase [Gemmataceae bacterium]